MKMRLDGYPTTKSGMFLLKKENFEDIGEQVLLEYMPQVLEFPQPLDIDYFISECLYLDVQPERLSEDGRILGLIAFADTEYEGLDDNNNSLWIKVPEGTILLEKQLVQGRHKGRLRFTKAHEASHWICHRTYHSPSNRLYDFRTKDDCSSIACRSERIEQPGRNANGRWTDLDWEEWQADNLGAVLLMPKPTFVEAFQRAMKHQGLYGSVHYYENTAKADAVIDEVKDIFVVSKRAVQLRAMRCGLMTMN